MTEKEASYAIDRNMEPAKFFALCDENLRRHLHVIHESHGRLTKSGVPEKYIFVIQANSDDGGRKEGDIFAYTNKERLEETLHSVRNGAQVCCSPDVFNFICVDVRDHVSMARHINTDYFSETWFNDMVADIT